MKFTINAMDYSLIGYTTYMKIADWDILLSDNFDYYKFAVYRNYIIGKKRPIGKIRLKRTSKSSCINVALMVIGSYANTGEKNIWIKNCPLAIFLSEVL
jgi:hypothetical protein